MFTRRPLIRQRVAWLALGAMLAMLLLPFMHRMPVQGALRLTLCSTAGQTGAERIKADQAALATTSIQPFSDNDSGPFKARPVSCPVCAISSHLQLAPPAAPPALPVTRYAAIPLRMAEGTGFFIPASDYLLPPGHAPPAQVA